MRTPPQPNPLVTTLALLTLLLAGCDLPRDMDGTLERARGGTIRVGVIENPPFAYFDDRGRPRGVEVALVRALAEDLAADVEWIRGPGEELLDALQRRALDLVVGGITARSPWRGRVGFTQPYLRTEIVLARAPGLPPPDAIDGEEVGYFERDPDLAAAIEEDDAVPVRLAPGDDPPALLALERRAALARGWQPAFTLRTRRHVLAVPPGENGWLVHLERFLDERRGVAQTLLTREFES